MSARLSALGKKRLPVAKWRELRLLLCYICRAVLGTALIRDMPSFTDRLQSNVTQAAAGAHASSLHRG